MAAHQAPPPLGFSRQEHWSGLPFPSPMRESEKWSEVAQSCLTLWDPMDCSLPGSSAHGIFQARVLEWGAIAFPQCFTRKEIKCFFLIPFFFNMKVTFFGMTYLSTVDLPHIYISLQSGIRNVTTWQVVITCDRISAQLSKIERVITMLIRRKVLCGILINHFQETRI